MCHIAPSANRRRAPLPAGPVVIDEGLGRAWLVRQAGRGTEPGSRLPSHECGADRSQTADQSPEPTDPTRTEARQPNRNHQSRGIPGGPAPRAKSLAPSRRSRPKAGKQPTKAPTQRIRRGQKPDNPTATTNRGGSGGLGPPGKIAKPARGEAGLKASKQPTPAWQAGLAPALLAAAPPLL